jgi:hypothetical protein
MLEYHTCVPRSSPYNRTIELSDGCVQSQIYKHVGVCVETRAMIGVIILSRTVVETAVTRRFIISPSCPTVPFTVFAIEPGDTWKVLTRSAMLWKHV